MFTVTRSLALIGFVAVTAVGCGGGDDVAKTAKPGDAFCDALEDTNDVIEDIRSVDPSDPDAVEDAFVEMLDSMKETAALAPQDATELMRDQVKSVENMLEVLEDNDFDIFAASDELEELDEEREELEDEITEYAEDNCDLELATDSTDDTQVDDTEVDVPDTTGVTDVPDGLVTAENFLDFYELGLGIEISDEIKDCFIDETSEVTQDEWDAAVNGTSSQDTQFAIGSAILACDVPLGQS